MKVNIYLETDKQCQARVRRRYGYVIEAVYAGRTETREGLDVYKRQGNTGAIFI